MKQIIRKKDLKEGMVFHRLTILNIAEKNCEVLCNCGVKKRVRTQHILSGDTKSCGCLHKEITKELLKTHGLSKKPEYPIWKNIIQRCKNPNSPAYNRYGGRGIKLCKRWERFPNFLADMGCRPSNNHSVDRVNNNGNYCAKNCKWSTPKEQRRNTSKNNIFEYQGNFKTLADWADCYKIPRGTLYYRLVLKKWEIQRALLEPVVLGKNQYNIYQELI